jgi:hypothetical protein
MYSGRITGRGGEPLTVSALYSILPFGDLVPDLITSLIILMALLIVSLIVIFLVPMSSAARSRDDFRSVAGKRAPVGTGSDVSATANQGSAAGKPGNGGKSSRPLSYSATGQKEAELFSPDSGVGWEKFLHERLDAELNRAASFEQDMVLLLIRVVGLNRKDQMYGVISRMLIAFFTFRDMIFEIDSDGFAVLLQNNTIDHGLGMGKEFVKKAKSSLKDEYPEGLPIAIGLSSRAGRLLSASTILQETKLAAEKAIAGGNGSVVSFKADSDKYRSFISGKA